MLRREENVRQTNHSVFDNLSYRMLAHDSLCLLTLRQGCDQECIELESGDRRWTKAPLYLSIRDVLYRDHR